VHVIVALFLLLMAKGRRKGRGEPMEITAVMRRALEPGAAAGLAGESRGALGSASGGLPVLASARQDVMDMVVRQPEEIAILLRSWLADRKTGE
jgi:flagellar biosynthesis/type III secretory pathway M-ring protein FliF/YscJ